MNGACVRKGAGSLRGIGTILAVLLVVGCTTASRYPERPRFVSAGSYDPVTDYLQKWIPVFMAEKKIPGLGIALADETGIAWAQGFGFADRERHVPFTAQTRSKIASVSKLFTCAAIMKLVEEGKINLDEPLTTYLPEFSIQTRGWPMSGITIRRMLTHHSGLPSDRLKGFIFGDTRPSDYPDSFLRLPSLLAEDHAATPPDTIFSYSNLAFSLLGNVVARVSGQTFENRMQETIFQPLGMRDSSFLMTDEDRLAIAPCYVAGKTEHVPYIRDIPAGGLVSTAADMGRFAKAFIVSADGKSDFLSDSSVR